MKERDREFIQKCLDEEDADVNLVIKDDGRFYKAGEAISFSGVQKVFFSKRFWEKQHKIKRLEYFKDGHLIRSVGYYRNGKVAIDHTIGKYPTRFHRDGTVDESPDVNHR